MYYFYDIGRYLRGDKCAISSLRIFMVRGSDVWSIEQGGSMYKIYTV